MYLEYLNMVYYTQHYVFSCLENQNVSLASYWHQTLFKPILNLCKAFQIITNEVKFHAAYVGFETEPNALTQNPHKINIISSCI